MTSGPVLVIGAGSGIGAAVARRFADRGHRVGVIARSERTVRARLSELPEGSTGATADVADETALRDALVRLVDDLGAPKMVLYNAGVVCTDTVDGLDARTLLDTLAVNVGGAVTTANVLLPRMAEADGGTYLMTAGMPDPLPELTSLSLGKAGLRALAELLDHEYGRRGVRCGTLTVCGPVAPGTRYDPEFIASEYERLHTLSTRTPDPDTHNWTPDTRFGDPADAAG